MAKEIQAQPHAIVTLAEAKAAGLRHYYVGEPCGYGHIDVRTVSGRGCLTCCRIRAKINRHLHPEKVKADNDRRDPVKLGALSRAYYAANADWLRPEARDRSYARYKADPLKSAAAAVAWRAKNLARAQANVRAWSKAKRKSDPQYRLVSNIRGRLRKAMAGKARNGSAVRDAGCSLPEMMHHLEGKFLAGMTWDNYGPVWHVDHVIPLTAFDLSDRAQILVACHYTNLQPMFASENIRKGGIRKPRSPKSGV